jgi:hypothetical protein
MGNGKTRGIKTDLGVNNQFANAVLHGLKSHPKATKRSDGVRLPIDEDTWQQVFKAEFPNRRWKKGRMQSLKTECGYYNRGDHGLGYDLDGIFDFGRGRRDKSKQNKGRSINDTKDAVRPGERSDVIPDEVIEIAKKVGDSAKSGNSSRVESTRGEKRPACYASVKSRRDAAPTTSRRSKGIGKGALLRTSACSA